MEIDVGFQQHETSPIGEHGCKSAAEYSAVGDAFTRNVSNHNVLSKSALTGLDSPQ